MRGRSFCYTILLATFVGAPPATRAQIAEILRRNGMTEAQYKRGTFIV